MKNFKILIICILIPNLAGIIGSLLGNASMGFEQIIKPSFTPPGFIFPIVWIILYTLMGISSYIIYSSDSESKNDALFVYGIQLLLNSLWTFFFFNLNWFLFSFIWLLAILIFSIIMVVKFYHINKTAAFLQIPYILWLIYAGLINLGVYILNM